MFNSIYGIVCYYRLEVWRLDKDCELHKTVVFDDYLVADINARNAFFAGGFIGVLVLVLTLFSEGVFDVFCKFVGLIPFPIVLVGDLTLNQKLESIAFSQKYAKIIDSLYGGAVPEGEVHKGGVEKLGE